jgi:hypothetical protein
MNAHWVKLPAHNILGRLRAALIPNVAVASSREGSRPRRVKGLPAGTSRKFCPMRVTQNFQPPTNARRGGRCERYDMERRKYVMQFTLIILAPLLHHETAAAQRRSPSDNRGLKFGARRGVEKQSSNTTNYPPPVSR